ncbi:SDR family NAD(P)-dependent oxidoreductase [Vibrio splendidus]|uniref:SDR family NAD(P)-dependent oxidoreductase n=1 Tax=Vibrio splendidus TaxID=29497 RepID=UPI00076A8D38|nr:SDR family oxidoreductase [Vibrio splendidus]PHX05751.1 3-oxoacyl-[acyl-carrier-protein] reductase FabG [Vibrio splendidus]
MRSQNYIITGTRKGLGKELAEYYLNQGHKVAGCSRGKSSISHENYLHFELDVADEKAVIKMIRRVKKDFGSIDVLLNNAGIAAMNHLLTSPYNNAKNVFSTNFFGTFLLTREVSKVMMRLKRGSIVNYTTVAVPLDLAGEAVYAASKAAVESFTRTSAKELGEFGIRVNAVGPTPVYTDLVRNIPKNKLDELLEQQIIHRFGETEDVRNVIDFFNKEESNFITGQIIYLGGVMK